MKFYPIDKIENLYDGYKKSVVLNDTCYLLMQDKGEVFCCENKCGHFGVALDEAEVCKGEITCPRHGISFSLISGEVINRPWEAADPITVVKVVTENEQVGIYL